MNKNALLWIALGGIGVYLLMRKKPQATTQANNDVQGGGIITPTPTPSDKKEKIYLGGLGVSPERKTDEELKAWYLKKYCVTIRQKRQPLPEEEAYNQSVLNEIYKRKLIVDCSGSADSNPQSQADCPEGTMFIRGAVSPCRPDTPCPRPRNRCINTRNDGINPKQPLALLLEQRIPTGIK